MRTMQRRLVLGATPLLLFGIAARSHASDEAVAALRRGGAAVLLRHAATEAGIGDPPGLRLDDCTTQRQLSPAGRAQSRRIGAWFAARRLTPAAVRSSAWCRCLETARLAFGRAEPWAALDSFFGDRSRAPARNRVLEAALARIPAGGFEVWVTHQVNITALTGEAVAMGEAWVVAAPRGAIERRVRLRFDA